MGRRENKTVTWKSTAWQRQMSDSYGKVVGGKLSLKNGLSLMKKSDHKKKKKKRKREKHNSDRNGSSKRANTKETPYELVREVGKGKVISSGTTITGIDTDFKKQLSDKDAFGVLHPNSGKEELKLVKFVLGKTSLSISSPFSKDIVAGVPFFIMKKKKSEQDIIKEREQKLTELRMQESEATGTSSLKLTYREKQGQGSYKLVSESVAESLSREELLDLRSRKKGDRRC